MKQLPFTIFPAEPTRVVVKGDDGKEYELRVQLTVTSVIDHENKVTLQTNIGPIEVPNITVNTTTTLAEIRVSGEAAAPMLGTKVSTGDPRPN